MNISRTRLTLILLGLFVGLGIVGRMDYEDAVQLEEANAKQTEVAKQ
jgi:hypothetical protein